MNPDRHERFQRLIDERLADAISAGKEQSLREHLATCALCMEYLSASNRVIGGLSGFSFEVDPALNARVMAAIEQHAQKPGRWRFPRLHHVPLKTWTAFATAMSMAFAGSAFMYEMATRLPVPMHLDMAYVQTGVFVFWLVPSLCAALCLLAAPDEKRGKA